MSPNLIPVLEEAVAFHEEYQIQRPWMPKPNPVTLEIAEVKELLAACKDAARYDWLRSQHWDTAKICAVASPKEAIKLGHYAPSGKYLDELIDKEMKEGN